jgi:crotonobetainyl-CoA:carnitine CoA-transferase CaiB-like acyl-CoA transferase
MRAPLKDIRVVDMTDNIAGPYATMLLAYCGAEVIKIESQLRLGFRLMGPMGFLEKGGMPVTPEKLEMGTLFPSLNRSKLSITLNMTKPKGRELAKQLVKVSDVVIDNFRFGVMQKWGLDYPSLKEIKSDIIVISLPGMGSTGRSREWVTWAMNLMSFTGYTHEWGYPDDSDRAISPSLTDYQCAVTAAIAILAALYYRARTGKGQCIELSQAEATASMVEPIFMDYFVNHRNMLPRGNRHPQFAPHNCYRCRGDDAWCVIAVCSESEWKCFCDALDQPPWVTDPKFRDMESRLKNVEELDKYIERWTLQYTPHQVMRMLQTFGVAAGAVQNGEHIFYDLHLRDRGFMDGLDHPLLGKLTYAQIPLLLSEVPTPSLQQPPRLGEHNEYVYRQLIGLSSDEIRTLIDEEVIF